MFNVCGSFIFGEERATVEKQAVVARKKAKRRERCS